MEAFYVLHTYPTWYLVFRRGEKKLGFLFDIGKGGFLHFLSFFFPLDLPSRFAAATAVKPHMELILPFFSGVTGLQSRQ